jgi:hypothetical protein
VGLQGLGGRRHRGLLHLRRRAEDLREVEVLAPPRPRARGTGRPGPRAARSGAGALAAPRCTVPDGTSRMKPPSSILRMTAKNFSSGARSNFAPSCASVVLPSIAARIARSAARQEVRLARGLLDALAGFGVDRGGSHRAGVGRARHYKQSLTRRSRRRRGSRPRRRRPGAPPAMPCGGTRRWLERIAAVIGSRKRTRRTAPCRRGAARAARARADREALQQHREAPLEHLGVGEPRVGHVGLHHVGAVEPRPGAGAAAIVS